MNQVSAFSLSTSDIERAFGVPSVQTSENRTVDENVLGATVAIETSHERMVFILVRANIADKILAT